MGFTSSGISINWGAEHRDGEDRLVSRQISVNAPSLPSCVKFSCLWKYTVKALTYTLISLYHQKRVAYAEANRGKKIEDKYRTGEPSPETFWQAVKENIKLIIIRRF